MHSDIYGVRYGPLLRARALPRSTDSRYSPSGTVKKKPSEGVFSTRITCIQETNRCRWKCRTLFTVRQLDEWQFFALPFNHSFVCITQSLKKILFAAEQTKFVKAIWRYCGCVTGKIHSNKEDKEFVLSRLASMIIANLSQKLLLNCA